MSPEGRSGTPALRAPGKLAMVGPHRIAKNPNNPRRFFNDERLDLLRTSLQEVGVLVPLIVYESPTQEGMYILMDGERRWTCSLDLGFETVPVNVIVPPSALDNLLQMFNIHSVRDEWPLISIALSLREVIAISGETRESRLAEMSGLTRSSVRRAKRLLSLPDSELELIQREAHLDRSEQVHREDLYLEIEAAESVLRNALPEIAEKYSREEIIRSFAAKREEDKLVAVTDYRDVGKLVKATENDLVDRASVVRAAIRLVEDVTATPSEVFKEVAALAYRQQQLERKAELFIEGLAELAEGAELSDALVERLLQVRIAIDRLLGDE